MQTPAMGVQPMQLRALSLRDIGSKDPFAKTLWTPRNYDTALIDRSALGPLYGHVFNVKAIHNNAKATVLGDLLRWNRPIIDS